MFDGFGTLRELREIRAKLRQLLPAARTVWIAVLTGLALTTRRETLRIERSGSGRPWSIALWRARGWSLASGLLVAGSLIIIGIPSYLLLYPRLAGLAVGGSVFLVLMGMKSLDISYVVATTVHAMFPILIALASMLVWLLVSPVLHHFGLAHFCYSRSLFRYARLGYYLVHAERPGMTRRGGWVLRATLTWLGTTVLFVVATYLVTRWTGASSSPLLLVLMGAGIASAAYVTLEVFAYPQEHRDDRWVGRRNALGFWILVVVIALIAFCSHCVFVADGIASRAGISRDDIVKYFAYLATFTAGIRGTVQACRDLRAELEERIGRSWESIG